MMVMIWTQLVRDTGRPCRSTGAQSWMCSMIGLVWTAWTS
jgi:hypothetical protein